MPNRMTWPCLRFGIVGSPMGFRTLQQKIWGCRLSEFYFWVVTMLCPLCVECRLRFVTAIYDQLRAIANGFVDYSRINLTSSFGAFGLSSGASSSLR